jgi:hypothetical protein
VAADPLEAHRKAIGGRSKLPDSVNFSRDLVDAEHFKRCEKLLTYQYVAEFERKSLFAAT